MKNVTALAAGLVLLAASAQASLVEDRLEDLCQGFGIPVPGGSCVIQRDFGQPGDAPGTQPGACVPSDRSIALGQTRSAFVVPVDDPADNVFLPIPASQVGREVTVSVDQTPLGQLLGDVSLVVFRPGCGPPVGAGATVRFIPTQAGNYVINAGIRGLLPVAAQGGEPGADACHPFCGDFLNNNGGYTVSARG